MLPDSNGVSPAPPYLRTHASGNLSFRIQDYYPLWWVFPDSSAKKNWQTPIKRVREPCNPKEQALWFRLFRFRSPLLSESLLISIPPGTEMFQFPGCASYPYVFRVRFPCTHGRVSSFGYPRITAWLTAPRGFSQPPTSFIACFSQGIHTMR